MTRRSAETCGVDRIVLRRGQRRVLVRCPHRGQWRVRVAP